MVNANVSAIWATKETSSARIVNGTRLAPGSPGRVPSVNACEMGLIRSILSFGTNATTELVPKMNIAAMMGTAMITDRPMDLAAPRHSPASIATESNPLRAPKLILPSRFNVSTEIAGSERVKGGYTVGRPVRLLRNGSAIKARNTATMMNPPRS